MNRIENPFHLSQLIYGNGCCHNNLRSFLLVYVIWIRLQSDISEVNHILASKRDSIYIILWASFSNNLDYKCYGNQGSLCGDGNDKRIKLKWNAINYADLTSSTLHLSINRIISIMKSITYWQFMLIVDVRKHRKQNNY